jgi:hypothetical protein
LPSDYDANVQYYKLNGTNINTGKVKNLYEALQKYFNDGTLDDFVDDPEDDSDLTDEFSFMTTYKISNLYNDLKKATTKNQKEIAVNKFLDEMWNEVGRTPLQKSYKEPYEKQQTQFIDYAKEDHENYSYYYTTVLILDSIKKAIDVRTKSIEQLEKEYQDIQKLNTNISAGLAMDKNFTENQLIRLSAFICEDELQLDDIVETDEDTIADSFKIKEDAIESGRIELHKLSQPKLQFSMTMANIYAIKDFEPIIDQFQLGNVIKVGLRKDYIKQSRLLQVDLEFDNLASLSTEFGELTNLRTQSDIHADLLGQAISAGKSVAQNSASWTKGSDTATSTDLRIQNGLLDAATVLKSIDGTQGVELGKYGLKMTKVNPDTGEIDPKQGWIVNNMMAYTDDNWKTTKTVLGEFQLRGEESSRWGLLADAVIAGHVEGSHIIGGDIKIGDIGTNSFPFQVNSDGDMTATSATIKGNSNIAGWSVTDNNIHKTSSGGSASMASSGNWAFMAGGTDYNNENSKAPFRVGFLGDVHATSGEIGGFTLGDKAIYKTKTSYNSDTDGVYLGTDGIGLGKKKFYVTSAGALTATDATITGKITTDSITATGGSIKTCTINNCTIDTASIPNLDASKITSGTIDTNRLNASVITTDNFSSKTLTTGNLTVTSGATVGGWSIGTDIISGKSGNYEARMNKAAIGKSGNVVFGVYNGSKWSAYIDGQGKLVASGASIDGTITATSGTFDNCTIKNCTIDTASIPSLDAGKITSGQFGAARIPNLSASKITSGTISTDRLDASVITTDNFSSKSLTTGNLTVTNGAKIGAWSVNSSGFLYNTYVTFTNKQLHAANESGTGSITASWYSVASAANGYSGLWTDVLDLQSRVRVLEGKLGI